MKIVIFGLFVRLFVFFLQFLENGLKLVDESIDAIGLHNIYTTSIVEDCSVINHLHIYIALFHSGLPITD